MKKLLVILILAIISISTVSCVGVEHWSNADLERKQETINSRNNNSTRVTYDVRNSMSIEETIVEVLSLVKEGNTYATGQYLIPTQDEYMEIKIDGNTFISDNITSEDKSELQRIFGPLEYRIVNINEINSEHAEVLLETNVQNGDKLVQETITLKKENEIWKIVIDNNFYNSVLIGMDLFLNSETEVGEVLQKVKSSVFEYIDGFYNSKKPHSFNNMLPPNSKEDLYYSNL